MHVESGWFSFKHCALVGIVEGSHTGTLCTNRLKLFLIVTISGGTQKIYFCCTSYLYIVRNYENRH